MGRSSYSVRFLHLALILLLAFGWVFSGWPRIFNFPPKIQKALAAITLITSGDIPGSALNGGNVTLSFSGASLLKDDVVVLFGGHSATAGSAVGPVLNGVADSSYTAIASQTGATSPNCGAWYKVMGASPDSQVVGTSTSVSTTAAAYEVLIFRGVDTSSVLDQTSVTASNTSGQPDGGAIVTQTANAWAVVMACSAVNDASRGSVSGWTTNTGATANDTGVDHSISAATLAVASPASTNPGAWSTAWSSAAWYAITIALKPASVPTLSTSDASSIGQTSATMNGNITNTGGAGPTVRGFAWGTSNTMGGDTATTSDTVGQPFGTGAFTDSSQTLVCNTTYYYRPYATNSIGTGYGAISNSFTTSACPAVYSVSITPAGTVEYGYVALSNASTTVGSTYTKTATNDGDATEKLNVKSSDATGGTTWTLASTIGTNQFKHEFSTTTGSSWTVMSAADTYVTAVPSVAVSGTATFDFRLTVPSSSTDYQQKSITITVQAVAPG
ncbi:hypothetical protein HY415_03040 [Candidatus Kaiserbacteria bacterium]|nr:hypothetical protein [Candidatus Kaiserbacteria bacterium]